MALQLPACLGAAFPPLTLKAHREPLTTAGLQLPACLGAAFPPLTLKAHREPLTTAGLQLPACLGAAFPPLTLKAHREPLTTHYKSQHSRLRPSLLFPPQTGSASILSPHGRIEFKKAPKCPPDPPRPQLYVTVLQPGPRAGGRGGGWGSRAGARAGLTSRGGGGGGGNRGPWRRLRAEQAPSVRGRACGEESGAETEAGGWPGVSGEGGSSGGTRPGAALTSHGGRRGPLLPPARPPARGRPGRPRRRRRRPGEAEGSRRGRARAAEAESDRGETAGSRGRPRSCEHMAIPGASVQGRPRRLRGGRGRGGGRERRAAAAANREPGARVTSPRGTREAAVTPPLAGAALCLLPVAMATQAARQPPGWGRAWFPPCQHRLACHLSHPPASALPLGLQAWAGPCLGP
jgi:hypothetical protein